MKVVICSANIGGIDEIHPPVKQLEPYELHYFTDQYLPFPLPNLNNRLKGKYFKTQAHRFINADIFIWIDGSVEIIDGHFVKWIQMQLSDAEIIAELHHERNNVYDELLCIINGIKSGKGYLMTRYANEPLKQEMDFYREQSMPSSFPLYKCSFFAWKVNDRTKEFFNQWWDMILKFSNFDQTAFSYVSWKLKVPVKPIDPSEYLIRHKHKP